MKNIFVILLAILTSLIILQTPVARSSTITVPTDYPNIQSAIDHASPGDTIVVRQGLYEGFRINKALTIVGEGPDKVIVNGTVEIRADNVIIESMKIVLNNPSSGLVSGVVTLAKGTLLENIVIESDASGIQVGDMDHYNADATLKEVVVVAGRLDYSQNPAGVWGACESLTVHSSSINTVNGHGVIGCRSLNIYLSKITAEFTAVKMGSGVLKNSQVSSKTDIGVAAGGANAVIESNTITGAIGVDIPSGSEGNIVFANVISGGQIGVSLAGSKNTISNNTISGEHAVELYGSDNMITYNNLTGGRGIHGKNGAGNIIAFNILFKTGKIGIYMSSFTSSNLIYGNTFWYCYNYNAADESGRNQWYFENESVKMGNYWYDHTSPDANSDGIVDTPYNITTTTDLNIVDKYPLAKPFIIPLQQYASTTTTTSFQTTGTTTTTPSQTTTSTSLITETSPYTRPEEKTVEPWITGYTIVALISVLIFAVILLFKWKKVFKLR